MWGQGFLLLEIQMTLHLLRFRGSCHLWAQVYTVARSSCKTSQSAAFDTWQKIAQSSANTLVCEVRLLHTRECNVFRYCMKILHECNDRCIRPSLMWLIYTRNSKGPTIEHRGTPEITLAYADGHPLHTTCCSWLVKRAPIHLCNSPLTLVSRAVFDVGLNEKPWQSLKDVWTGSTIKGFSQLVQKLGLTGVSLTEAMLGWIKLAMVTYWEMPNYIQHCFFAIVVVSV